MNPARGKSSSGFLMKSDGCIIKCNNSGWLTESFKVPFTEPATFCAAAVKQIKNINTVSGIALFIKAKCATKLYVKHLHTS